MAAGKLAAVFFYEIIYEFACVIKKDVVSLCMAYAYKKVKLFGNITRDEHRIVWEAHYGKIPSGMIIHHKDGNKMNNDIANLEMMSLSDHSKHHKSHNNFIHPRKESQCGTELSYKRGCRCAKCKEWRKMKERAYRAKKKLLLIKK